MYWVELRFCLWYIMYQSIPAVPNPPPLPPALIPWTPAHVVSPGIGTFAFLSPPGGWAFAYPAETSGILQTCFHGWVCRTMASPSGTYRGNDIIEFKLKAKNWNREQLFRPCWVSSARTLKAYLRIPVSGSRIPCFRVSPPLQTSCSATKELRICWIRGLK